MKEESNPFNAFEAQSKQLSIGFWGILLLALCLIIAFTFVATSDITIFFN